MILEFMSIYSSVLSTDTTSLVRSANRIDWLGLAAYFEDVQCEALVDVLPGRVKVHTH